MVKRRTLAYLICLFQWQSGCGSSSSNSNKDTPTSTSTLVGRALAGSSFPSVGRINNLQFLCSGVILMHGLFVSAKHCFKDYTGTSQQLAAYIIKFSNTGDISTPTVSTTITDIEFDGSQNDLAYVFYDSSKTSGKIAIDATQIDRTVPVTGELAAAVGFPTTSGGINRRFLSSGCDFTGKSGTIAATSTNEGYDGLLYALTCPGWWGNSGGPIYRIDSSGKPLAVVGVVTHTFDIVANGDLDTTKEATDQYGTYILDTAISTYSEAAKLDAMIARVK